MGIMIGTDFHPGIPGIGPKTGLKLIKQYGTIERICEEKERNPRKSGPYTQSVSSASCSSIRASECQ